MPVTRGCPTAVTGLAAAVLCAALVGQADDSFKEGLRKFHAGDYQSAKKRFGASGDPRTGAFSAIVEAALGGCSEALLALEAAAGGDPATAKLAGLAAVRCAIAEKQFGKALNNLAALREGYPGDPELLYETPDCTSKGGTRPWPPCLRRHLPRFASTSSRRRSSRFKGATTRLCGNIARQSKRHPLRSTCTTA